MSMRRTLSGFLLLLVLLLASSASSLAAVDGGAPEASCGERCEGTAPADMADVPALVAPASHKADERPAPTVFGAVNPGFSHPAPAFLAERLRQAAALLSASPALWLRNCAFLC